jgi:chaperonin GroES
MKFRPLRDRVVLRRLEEEARTAGGVIIPDTAQEKPMQGEILAVGPGALDKDGNRIAMALKVGDRVFFGKFSGTEVKVDGEEILILNESDIMGVLDDRATMTRSKAA